ncbi:MAG: acyl-CoA thioesterase [Sphingomonadales bacterium]|nr:acyl-CoA thioesterase [Sphingomonadales bacterium]
MFQYNTSYRVCYADTDQMRFMYYGNYARLYEIGRVESLRTLGCHYSEFEDSGIWMPVLDLHARYLKPAFYDDELNIETRIPMLPGARIHFEYSISRSGGAIIHEAQTVLVFLLAESGKPCRAPDRLISALSPFFPAH